MSPATAPLGLGVEEFLEEMGLASGETRAGVAVVIRSAAGPGAGAGAGAGADVTGTAGW